MGIGKQEKNPTKFSKYVYWMAAEEWRPAKKQLIQLGYSISAAKLVPCKILKASGKKLMVAPPSSWSRFCYRQGSWYRESPQNGKYVLVSGQRLHPNFDRFLDARITESDFMPASLPSEAELEKLVASPCYQDQKPAGWEKVRRHERIMLRLVFTLKGFGKWHETFDTYWLAHRANHANFLCKQFTTEKDGQTIPYSISENRGVCSPCAEFFNLINKNSRKLVRACPGAIISGVAKHGPFYHVQPGGALPLREP